MLRKPRPASEPLVRLYSTGAALDEFRKFRFVFRHALCVLGWTRGGMLLAPHVDHCLYTGRREMSISRDIPLLFYGRIHLPHPSTWRDGASNLVTDAPI